MTDDDKWDEKCKCEECPEKLKDKCVTDDKKWEDKPKEDCKCDECSEELKDVCVEHKPDTDNPINGGDDLCWNGRQDSWETCESCPEDFNGCAKGNDCNSCPCEYVDFAANLTRGDTIRAKFWDKPRFVFYNYSNTLNVEDYLDNK